MPNEQTVSPNVPLVSYISPEVFARVRQAARTADRSIAAEIRHLVNRTYARSKRSNDDPCHRILIGAWFLAASAVLLYLASLFVAIVTRC